jgi:hypothetical protein
MTGTNSFRTAAITLLGASCLLVASVVCAKPAVSDVNLTGLLTCAHCVGSQQPLHKGFTPWTWALYSVKQGDDVVLVVADKTYKVQGDRDLLLKYIADKATVTGRLDGNTILVTAVTHPAKSE